MPENSVERIDANKKSIPARILTGSWFLVRSSNFWAVVSALAGVASAVAALLTIQASNEARIERIKSQRPYFVLIAPKFQVSGNGHILNLNLKNQGVRPASNVIYNLVSLPTSALNTNGTLRAANFEISRSKFEISSEIASEQPSPWWLNVKLPKFVPPKIYRLTITYSDALLDDKYQQVYDMKWAGVKNGQTNPDLTFTTKGQSTALTNFLKNLQP